MSSRIIRFVSARQVMRLYELHVKQSLPSQTAYLESAIASPQNKKHYEGQTDVFNLAGTLAQKIILNHAFQDGNKRAALLAADLFLKINGYYLQEQALGPDSNDETLKDAHRAVASNEWTDAELAECYRSIAKPLASEKTEEFFEEAQKL